MYYILWCNNTVVTAARWCFWRLNFQPIMMFSLWGWAEFSLLKSLFFWQYSYLVFTACILYMAPLSSPSCCVCIWYFRNIFLYLKYWIASLYLPAVLTSVCSFSNCKAVKSLCKSCIMCVVSSFCSRSVGFFVSLAEIISWRKTCRMNAG